MKHITLNGRDLVLSRNRNGFYELVDAVTGEFLKIPTSTDIGSIRLQENVIVPGQVPFSQRPISFLTELRQKRVLNLREARKTKARKKPLATSIRSKPRS
jgi:hypothetical protein